MTNGRQSELGCVWLHHLRAVSDAGGRSTAADSAVRHTTMQTADNVAFCRQNARRQFVSGWRGRSL